MAVVKVYNGSTWDTCSMKVWTGSEWVDKAHYRDTSDWEALYPVGGISNFPVTNVSTANVIASAIYETFGSASSADSDASIYVRKTSTNCTVTASGNQTGGSTDQGSSVTGTGTKLTLNAVPDTVQIVVTGESTTGGGDDYNTTLTHIGTFTEDVDFNPTQDVDYGIWCQTDTTSSAPGGESADSQCSVTFIFKKSGYNDYTLGPIFLQSEAQSNYDS